MDFGQVIGRAFPILGRHRYLLVLGVLGGGEFGGFSLSTPSFNSPRTGGSLDPDAVLRLAILLVVAAGAFVIVWALLSLVTTPALIRAAAEHDAARPFTFGRALRAGLQSAWKVLVLRLLMLVALALVVLVAALPVLGPLSYLVGHHGEGVTRGLAAMIGAFVVSVLLLVVLALLVLLPLGVVMQLALRSAVLELTGPLQALGRAFRLVTRRFGRVALTWLISVGFGLAAGLLMGIVLTPLALALSLALVTLTTPATVAILASAFLGLVVVAVNGVIGSFFSVYWTLAFRRLEL